MTEETKELTDELRATNRQLSLVLTRLEDVRELQEHDRRRAIWHRIGTLLLTLTVLGVIGLGWAELNNRDRAEEQGCERLNSARADIRASIIETLLVIAERSGQPEEIAGVIDEIHDRLVVTLPDLSC